MAYLESLGLLYSPHTSSGRVPTESGLRLFVQGLLQVGTIDADDERRLQGSYMKQPWSLPNLLEEAVSTLSGLTRCAGLVVAPKGEAPLKHIEFVSIGEQRALLILVFSSGEVENRIITIPENIPLSALTEAANFLNAKCLGLTISEVRDRIYQELESHRHEINALSRAVMEAGLGNWTEVFGQQIFIIKGQSHLLEDIQHLEDLERLRLLFAELETRENLMRIVDASIEADGIQIFIGSENPLFNFSGCSMIVAPYRNAQEKIIGVIGVLGPRHLNYARIIPMVDYTAQILTKFLG
jgi:heat-inducible transcriptional repressor